MESSIIAQVGQGTEQAEILACDLRRSAAIGDGVPVGALRVFFATGWQAAPIRAALCPEPAAIAVMTLPLLRGRENAVYITRQFCARFELSGLLGSGGFAGGRWPCQKGRRLEIFRGIGS